MAAAENEIMALNGLFNQLDLDSDGVITLVRHTTLPIYTVMCSVCFHLVVALHRVVVAPCSLCCARPFNCRQLVSAVCQDEAREYYKIKVDQMITVGLLPALDYYAKQEYVLEKVPPSHPSLRCKNLLAVPR